ncbi:hypothetical protein [Myceligenerans salitolerans]|uniref:Uncharacterized protein n=1 Tax=Myceligenerans salitolerans TaxID=1230528 RepID=A0ABS3I374_9MICO|nr:hypothetical protein [Myceligenerans salitolerans]MBO0607448.1 hypothetical protein [Myceligenerans salitolerans]
MFLRTVILPATALLIPGSGGIADPLAPVRLAVCAALASLAENGPPMVLAHGARGPRGPVALRPSLAAAGIGDRMLPGDVTAPWAAHGGRPTAGTSASVALLCLGMALGERAAGTLVVEAPSVARHHGTDTPRVLPGAVVHREDGGGTAADAAGAIAAHLAAGGTLVVAAGRTPGPAAPRPGDPNTSEPGPGTGPELTPGVGDVLTAVGTDGWVHETRVFPQDHDHLPAEYRLTTSGPRLPRPSRG